MSKQLLMSTTGGNIVKNNYYCPIQSGGNATENLIWTVIPTAGSLSNLRFNVDVAPGAGESWTCTLFINSSGTTLASEITGTNKYALSTSTVSVNPGDTISFRITGSATPADTPGHFTYDFTPTVANRIIIMGFGAGSPANATYGLLCGGASFTGSSTDKKNRQICFGRDATLSNFYFKIDVAPGAEKTRTVEIRDGAAAATGLTITLGAGDTSGSDTEHTYDVSPATFLQPYFTMTSGTAAVTSSAWGCVIVPDDSTIGTFLCNAMKVLVNNADRYCLFSGQAANLTSRMDLLWPEFEVKGLYLNTDAAPGAGKQYKITLQNAGSDTSVTATVKDAERTATWTGTHTVATTDGNCYIIQPSDTPTAIRMSMTLWGDFPDESSSSSNSSSSSSQSAVVESSSSSSSSPSSASSNSSNSSSSDSSASSASSNSSNSSSSHSSLSSDSSNSSSSDSSASSGSSVF